jgi:hypothetical protein
MSRREFGTSDGDPTTALSLPSLLQVALAKRMTQGATSFDPTWKRPTTAPDGSDAGTWPAFLLMQASDVGARLGTHFTDGIITPGHDAIAAALHIAYRVLETAWGHAVGLIRPQTGAGSAVFFESDHNTLHALLVLGLMRFTCSTTMHTIYGTCGHSGCKCVTWEWRWTRAVSCPR